MKEWGLSLEAYTPKWFAVIFHRDLFLKFNKDRNISES